jgi:uncharacterized membrane protein YcaP (DUF421 family)
MSTAIEFLFGSGSDLSALQMSVRAVIVFVLTPAFIRVAGRSSFGQHRPFDACATVLLGAVLSWAVVGASPFGATLSAGAAIVLLHRLVALASLRWPRFESLVTGRERVLVHDGVRVEHQMRMALVTPRDLDEAIRKRTGDAKTDVERVMLERDGDVTVMPKRPRDQGPKLPQTHAPASAGDAGIEKGQR